VQVWNSLCCVIFRVSDYYVDRILVFPNIPNVSTLVDILRTYPLSAQLAMHALSVMVNVMRFHGKVLMVFF